jgi:hypothetical protein
LVFVYCKYKRGSWLARKNRTRRDYYAVSKGFPLVSAPVAESEFDDFKGANYPSLRALILRLVIVRVKAYSSPFISTFVLFFIKSTLFPSHHNFLFPFSK